MIDRQIASPRRAAHLARVGRLDLPEPLEDGATEGRRHAATAVRDPELDAALSRLDADRHHATPVA